MDFSSFFNYSEPEQPLEQETFLASFTEKDWNQFLPYTLTQLCNKNDVVINYEDTDRSLFILIEGSVDVLLPTRHFFGKQKKIITLSEGSVFGELSFLDCAPRSAIVQANCTSKLLMLTLDAFEKLRVNHPNLSELFILELAKILARRLRRTTQILGVNL